MRKAFYSSSNGPTWSCHRDQQLQSCERKYYFQYLADARLNSADPWLRGMALLKKLKNFPMWQGECVHAVIAEHLDQVRQGQSPTLDRLTQSLRQRMQRDWLFSEKRRFREEPASVGKFGVALFEHEYDELPPETQLEALIERAVRMLGCYFLWATGKSGLLENVRMADRIWIEPPAWGTDAPGFMVGKVQVITKVDLALHRRGVEFTIYDWKTGKAPAVAAEPGQNEIQISIYMLWANLGLKLPLDGVTSRLIYLGGDEPIELRFDLDEERAVETYRLIEDSVNLAQQWESHFENRRLRLNDLDYAGSVEECRRCNFKRLCRANLLPEKPL
jgi:hypothetical protein